MAEPPRWYDAEAEYTDEVVGEETLGELFAATVDRNAERAAQRYKGGVYDRSLTDSVVPRPADGEYTSISYERNWAWRPTAASASSPRRGWSGRSLTSPCSRREPW
jgi:hypothetical protein